MRIDSISVDGFGVWHEARIEPDPGLTVVRGDNEAGKTTLLAFVRAVLFGFETNRHPALAGGRRGGWLEITMADERRYRIERYGDRGGEGALRVIGEDGVDRGPGFLQRLLHGVEASVYRNVFAFRLEELSEFRGLTEGGVAARIYGAGLGTGAASALTVESALRSEAASLFKSGGSNPRINQLLRQIEELDRELARLDLPGDYAARRQRLADLDAERARITTEVEARAAERRRLERIDAGWEHWLAWRAAQEELQREPDPGSLPAGALERFSRLAEAVRASEERLEEIERRRRRVGEKLSAQVPDPQLLARRAEIEQLVEEQATSRAHASSLAEARSELRNAEDRLREHLGELGAGWDESRVAALDLSVATRAVIGGRFREQLDGTAREFERARLELSAAERAATDAAEEVSRLEARVTELDDDGKTALAEHERVLARLAAAIAARDRLEGRTAPASRPAWLPFAAIGAGLASAYVAWELTGAPWLGILLVAMGLVGAVIARRWAGASTIDPGHTVRELEAEIARDAAIVDLPSRPARADVDQAGVALDARRVRAAQRAGVQEQERMARQRRGREDRAAALARDRLAAATKARSEAEEQWSTWLRERGLDPTLDRESAAAVLEAASSVRAAMQRRDDARRLVDQLAARQAAHLRRADALLSGIGRAAQPDDLPAAVDRLRTDLRSALDASAAAERLRADLEELLAEGQAARERRDRDAAALDELLASCGVSTETELRELDGRVERWRHRKEASETARRALAALSGPGEAVDRLLAEIAVVDDIAELRERLGRIRRDSDELTAKRDAVIEEIGALQHQIASLEASVEASERRQQRADLIARLEEEAERWTVSSLAVALLERTRQRYEREHRPGVIRAAEAFLADWTGGRYRQIVAPLGGTIEGVERADGRRVPIAGLSRGTAEQLYLALRFGLIEHFADEAEPLPIVMDEILVNFDEERAERAAHTIGELARRHQILYFTCRADTPLRGGTLIRLEPATLGAAVGADRPPALERG